MSEQRFVNKAFCIPCRLRQIKPFCNSGGKRGTECAARSVGRQLRELQTRRAQNQCFLAEQTHVRRLLPALAVSAFDDGAAAEFFAAALDEYDAAVIVGTQTCGKGYFQSSFELSDGSAVGLSIGKYTTPNGVSLADVGITPEVYVEVDEETAFQIYAGVLAPEEDPQIQAAIAALREK